MKGFYPILLLLLLADISLLSQEPINTDDNSRYRVVLRDQESTVYKTYDTIIPLSYLLEPTQYEYIPKFEYFIEFSYPALKLKESSDHFLCLINDSIRITLTTNSFSRAQLEEILTKDEDYFKRNRFWGLDEVNLDRNIDYLPHNILSEIIIVVNGFESQLEKKYFRNFFDVNIHCDEENCGTSAYVTDEGRIIIQMNNSSGAGFYYAIFIFDAKGKLEEWVIKHVI